MDSVFCGMLRPSSKIEGSQKMPNNRRGRNSLAARNHFYENSRLHDGTQQIRFQWTQRSDPKRVFLAPNHCRIPTSWSKTWVSPLVSAWEALIGWPYTVTCSEAEIVRTYFRFCGNQRSGMCWNFMAKEWPMVMESAESSALLSYAWSKAGLDAVKLGDIKKKWKNQPSNSKQIQIHHCLYVQVDISQHSLRNRDISQKASSCNDKCAFWAINKAFATWKTIEICRRGHLLK